MSNNLYGPTPPAIPPQPPRKMGTGVKLLLIFGILFVVLALICCGGIGYMFYWGNKSLIKDPAVVKETTKMIADISIPEPLKPEVPGMDMKIPVTGKTMMIMVLYADHASGSTLMLMGFGEMFQGQSEVQMQQSMEESMRKQGVNQAQREQIENGKISTKEVKINGKPAKFTITTGQGAASHKARIEVTGAFHGRCGPAILQLNADAEKITPEKVEAMLDSIR